MTHLDQLLEPARWYLDPNTDGDRLRTFWVHRDVTYELILRTSSLEWRVYAITTLSLRFVERGTGVSETDAAAKAVTALQAEMHKADSKAKIDAYLAALVAVGKEHGFSLSHEDGHGRFLVENRDEGLDDMLMYARDAR